MVALSTKGQDQDMLHVMIKNIAGCCYKFIHIFYASFRCRRFNNCRNPCYTVRRKASKPRMFPYQVFAWRRVNAIYFITSHITMNPLNIGSQGTKHFSRFLGDGFKHFIRKFSCVWNISFNNKFWHVSKFLFSVFYEVIRVRKNYPNKITCDNKSRLSNITFSTVMFFLSKSLQRQLNYKLTSLTLLGFHLQFSSMCFYYIIA